MGYIDNEPNIQATKLFFFFFTVDTIGSYTEN